MKTVVGMYRTVEEANNVKRALENEGYSSGDLTVMDQSEGNYQGGTGTGATGDGSVGDKIKNFFSGLTGHDDDVHQSYTQGVTNGGALVALRVSDDQVQRAASVLESHGAQQVRGGEGAAYNQSTGGYGSGSYGSGTTGTGLTGTGTGAGLTGTGTGLTGTNTTGQYRGEEAEFGRGPVRDYDIADTHELGTGTANTGRGTDLNATTGRGTDFDTTGTRGNVTGEQVIPVVAEELVVGKREVERGGVRVYSHVVSENVSENVNLHDERVLVDRRTVDRPATDADFRDAGPIEVRAMGEEAVVGKAGRVVEEVVVGKTAADHTETVNDSVRHTEVNVEPIEVDTTRSTNTTTTTNKY